MEDGQRVLREVSGRTKSEVKDRLKALHEVLDHGVKPSASYKVADTLTDAQRGRSGGPLPSTRGPAATPDSAIRQLAGAPSPSNAQRLGWSAADARYPLLWTASPLSAVIS